MDEALKYLDGPEAALLKSFKRNFGTEAYLNERDMDSRAQQEEEHYATIGPAPPPTLSDHARRVLDLLLPGMTTAYDRWRTGYYQARPWTPGPAYDALPGLMVLVTSGLAGIQAALTRAVNPTEIAALQNARRELLKIWDLPYFPRGEAMEILLGRNLPKTFKCIDRWENGVATSIKTMDLRLKWYQDPANILRMARGYVRKVAEFNGATMKRINITTDEITGRVLRLGVNPEFSKAQESALKSPVYLIAGKLDVSVTHTQ